MFCYFTLLLIHLLTPFHTLHFISYLQPFINEPLYIKVETCPITRRVLWGSCEFSYASKRIIRLMLSVVFIDVYLVVESLRSVTFAGSRGPAGSDE